jgi:hypothetical protein
MLAARNRAGTVQFHRRHLGMKTSESIPMAKQLLIYESAVPVSASQHAQVSLEPAADYAFSAGINAVPLMTVEFLNAAAEYAIVFTPAGDDVIPATAARRARARCPNYSCCVPTCRAHCAPAWTNSA